MSDTQVTYTITFKDRTTETHKVLNPYKFLDLSWKDVIGVPTTNGITYYNKSILLSVKEEAVDV